MLIDTHCHLNFKAFEGKVEKVIQRAKKSGVKKIIVPGTNLETSKKAVELAEKYDGVYATVGIHPHHASQVQSSKFKVQNELKKLARSKKVVAIGECGLDYYQYKKTPASALESPHRLIQPRSDRDALAGKQKQLFIIQIQLAKKLNLPLIIHNRQADQNLFEMINGQWSMVNGCLKGVLHCFQGNNQLLNWAIKRHFYIGITGIVTYDKKMQEVVRKTPLKNILIETDAPYLMPEPMRRTKKWPNEPKNVKIVVERIAKIKGDSFLNVTKKTSDNAIKLFKI